MKKILLCIVFFFIGSLVSPLYAASLSKEEACTYPEGIHWNPIYVYWPGELPRVDGFVKKDNKLHYFIHIFDSSDAIDRYVASDNSPYTKKGFIRNKASYFVTFDCSRSKVKFSPLLRSTRGDQYGKFLWIDGNTLAYSISSYNPKSSCKFADDVIIDVPTMTRYNIEKSPNYPEDQTGYCLSRSRYKNRGDGILRFQIEKYKLSTKESWFSLYEYNLLKKSLSKIR